MFRLQVRRALARSYESAFCTTDEHHFLLVDTSASSYGRPYHSVSQSAERALLSHTALDMPRSGIRVVMDLAWKLEAEGKEILHLEVGQPDFGAPPHAIEAAQQALSEGLTKYIPNAGLNGLRRSVARTYIERGSRYSTTAYSKT